MIGAKFVSVHRSIFLRRLVTSHGAAHPFSLVADVARTCVWLSWMQRTLMGALHSGTIITLVDACREHLTLRLVPHVLEGRWAAPSEFWLLALHPVGNVAGRFSPST